MNFIEWLVTHYSFTSKNGFTIKSYQFESEGGGAFYCDPNLYWTLGVKV